MRVIAALGPRRHSGSVGAKAGAVAGQACHGGTTTAVAGDDRWRRTVPVGGTDSGRVLPGRTASVEAIGAVDDTCHPAVGTFGRRVTGWVDVVGAPGHAWAARVGVGRGGGV